MNKPRRVRKNTKPRHNKHWERAHVVRKAQRFQSHGKKAGR